MNRKIQSYALVAFLLLGIVIFFALKSDRHKKTEDGEISAAKSEESLQPQRRSLDFEVLEAIGTGPPQQDLELIARAMRVYSNLVRDGGRISMPPATTNRMLTRSLTGENRAGLEVIPPGHPSVSESGELLDRWGTPYQFHAVSSQSIGVRSAGPDRQMYTSDDVSRPAEEKILYLPAEE